MMINLTDASYLEEGVRRNPERQTEKLLLNAALSGHELAGQILRVGRFSLQIETAVAQLHSWNTEHQCVFYSPLTVSNKV